MRSIPCHLLVPLLALAVLGGPAGQPGQAIPPPAPDEMRVQEVLAATTLQLAPQGIPFPNPNPLTVHLACIRVPQGAGTAAAMAAQQALANQLPIGSWVVIRELAARGTDGSLWAEVFSRRWEAPLNLQLVARGLALASDASPAQAVTRSGVGPGCDRERYAAAQSRARSLGLGLWHSRAAPEIPPRALQTPWLSNAALALSP